MSSGPHHLGNTSLGMGWPLRTASIFAIASSAIIWMAWTVAVPMWGVIMMLFNFNKGWSLQETEQTECITHGIYSVALTCQLLRTKPQETAMAYEGKGAVYTGWAENCGKLTSHLFFLCIGVVV